MGKLFARVGRTSATSNLQAEGEAQLVALRAGAEVAMAALRDRRWAARAWRKMGRPPRVLYVVLQFPQLSESHIYAEIACMRRLGAAVQVWARSAGASPFAHDLVVHRDSIAAAVRAFAPDLIHVHWFTVVEENLAELAACDVPITVRGHSFDATAELLRKALRLPTFGRGYLLPGSASPDLPPDPRLRLVAPIFDSELFKPAERKDTRLVLRASPGLTWNNLRFMIDLANRLPNHRVVVAIARGTNQDAELAALQSYKAETRSPVELRIDVPRAEIGALFASAGIYVHSSTPSDGPVQKRVGGPVSVAEAMATGAYVLVRNVPAFANYVGDAGATYADVDEAAALVHASEAWTEAQWQAARWRSVERAYRAHADEIALRPVFEDWCAIAGADARAPAG